MPTDAPTPQPQPQPAPPGDEGKAGGGMRALGALTGLALAFAFSGRRRNLLVRLAGAAIVLGGLSILIGSV